MDELQKGQRYIGFPKLGIEDRRETPILNTQQQLRLKHAQIRDVAFKPAVREAYPDYPEEKLHEMGNKFATRSLGTSYGAVIQPKDIKSPYHDVNISFAHSNPTFARARLRAQGALPPPASANRDLATKLHEDFHQMMHRVEKKYGTSARHKLAQNLWNVVLHNPNLRVADLYATIRNQGLEEVPHYNEEKLASLHNYLNDEQEREMFFNHLGSEHAYRRYVDNGTKAAFKAINEQLPNVDESWLTEDKNFRPVKPKGLVRKPALRSPPIDMKPISEPPKVTPPMAETKKVAKKKPIAKKKRIGARSAEDVQGDLFKKSQEQDEVARLLLHPSPAERKMALKLATVRPDHLKRAFYDGSPEIQQAALNHPAMSHSVLEALMHMPHSDSLQMLAMQHPMFDKSHLKSLYNTHRKGGSQNVLDAIIGHSMLDGDMIRDIYHDGNGTRAMIANLNTPADVIEHVITKHFAPGHDKKSQHRYLVMEALKHPNANHELVERAIREGDEGIQLAAAQSQHLPANVAEDFLKRGHTGAHEQAFLRSALVTSPHATGRHLDMGLDDLNPLVRSAVFATKSPHLDSKHVDRALQQGRPHTIIVALKSKAADSSHLGKLLNDKRPEVRALADSYQKKSAIKKYEENLASFYKSNSFIGRPVEPNSEIVKDMLGYDYHKNKTFEAAKHLIAGNEPTLDQVRKALWQADGDPEKAALLAYGMEPSEGNLKALRAVRDIVNKRKAEEQPVKAATVLPGTPDAEKAAEGVKYAFEDNYVLPVELGGKHSKGSLLARDMRGGKVYLLKPGSGPISPAAGDSEEKASQSRREAGFWHVADQWALGDYLPRADLVLIDGIEYACIELLPWKYKTLDKLKQKDPSIGQRLLAPYLDSGALHRWAILDYVLGNPDRHANNLMADATGDTVRPDVKLIDHGSAMAGPDFDPAYDESSFVPYYLRAWAPGSFNDLDEDQKLKVMPRLHPRVAEDLHGWLSDIHAHELQLTLIRYGIDPEPALGRLAKLKMMISQEPVDLAINKLWITT